MVVGDKAIESIAERVRRYREYSISSVEGQPNQYSIVPFFQGTSFEEQGIGISSQLFRSFEPIKPQSGRAMRGASFDKFTNTLFDYPNIIAEKMQKSWQRYNYLISLHVACCPYDCWYCYVDECLRLDCNDCRYYGHEDLCKHIRDRLHGNKFTAEIIFEEFLSERAGNKFKRNVLRVTGGEPFLVPELIKELLDLRNYEGLEDEVFLWTETNIVPFIKDKSTGKRLIESYSNCNLNELSEYRNWALHPCLHGSSSENLKLQTGFDVDFSAILEGLCYLVTIMGADIYPTLASNVCPPNELAALFKELDTNCTSLPLKVALIENYLGYPPVQERIRHDGFPLNCCFDNFTNVRTWNDLCESTYGFEYASVPREKVVPGRRYFATEPTPREIAVDTEDIQDGDFIYVFKACYRPLYKKELLTLLALPKDQDYQLEYRDDLIVDNLLEDIPVGRNSKGQWKENRSALLVYMDKNDDGDDRFVPLRFMEVCCPYRESGVTTLRFMMKDYVLSSPDFTKELREILGNDNLPRPGVVGQKWVFASKDISHHVQPNRQFGEVIRELTGEGPDSCLSDWRESCFCNVADIEMMKLGRWYLPFGHLLRKSGRLTPKVIAQSGSYLEHGYSLTNTCTYQIPVELLNPHYDSQVIEDNQLILRADTQDIAPFTNAPISVSKYHREEFRFRVDKTLFRRKIADIRIAAVDDSCNCLSAKIKVRLVPDYLRLVVFLIFVVLGISGLAVSLSVHGLSTLSTFAISALSILAISLAGLWYTGYLSGFTG